MHIKIKCALTGPFLTQEKTASMVEISTKINDDNETGGDTASATQLGRYVVGFISVALPGFSGSKKTRTALSFG